MENIYINATIVARITNPKDDINKSFAAIAVG